MTGKFNQKNEVKSKKKTEFWLFMIAGKSYFTWLLNR
jgi:hypothetical protein